MVATSTLAWGVNFPAHLVVVKGTEFYDGKTRRYVDFPITGLSDIWAKISFTIGLNISVFKKLCMFKLRQLTHKLNKVQRTLCKDCE